MKPFGKDDLQAVLMDEELRSGLRLHWKLVTLMMERALPWPEIQELLRRCLHTATGWEDVRTRRMSNFWDRVIATVRDKPELRAEFARYTAAPNPIRDHLSRLDSASFVVCAYNQPYTHHYRGNTIVASSELSISVGSVMHELLQAVGRASSAGALWWVALGSTAADFDPSIVNGRNECAVTKGEVPYLLKRVRTSPDEYRGYKTFANDVLSPVLHMTRQVTQNYRRFVNHTSLASWSDFVKVNGALAEATTACLEGAATSLLQIHDFEVCLVARHVRKRLPSVSALYFSHVAWPSSEHFALLRDQAVRREILRGLLSCDCITFHTWEYAKNFLSCVRRELPEEVSATSAGVVFEDRPIAIRVVPLGVSTARITLNAARGTYESARLRVQRRLNLGPNEILCISAERTDFTKGTLERLRAIDLFFEAYPEHVGKIRFVQVLVPSRQYLPSYKALHEEIVELTRRINQRWESGNGLTIHTEGPMDRESLVGLFCASDILWVNSLIDGLCLVPKEYVASQGTSARAGVVLLSKFAGAAVQLDKAFIIDPFDIAATAHTLHSALTLSTSEKRMRMASLYRNVTTNDLEHAVAQLLSLTVNPHADLKGDVA